MQIVHNVLAIINGHTNWFLTKSYYGGNVSNSTVTVVIIPSMEEDGDVRSKQLKQEGLYDEKHVKRIIANESRR